MIWFDLGILESVVVYLVVVIVDVCVCVCVRVRSSFFFLVMGDDLVIDVIDLLIILLMMTS